MAGWLFIISSASTSILIAHFLKVSETKNLNTIRVLTVNYFIATAIAFFFSLMSGHAGYSAESVIEPLLIAVIVGVIFIVNFFIYSKSVYHHGVGISIAAMRISLIIPVLLSTFWYYELLSILQWVGVFLVFATLFMLLPRKKKIELNLKESGWLLVLLFLGTGIGDASLKIYESEYSIHIGKEMFMGFVFLTAFITGMMALVIRKELSFSKKELLIGVAVGIPNLFTSIFLIMALERMNGAVVYSSVNVLTVLGGTILGVILWKDTFTKSQWIGIFLTLISIVLLIQ